MNDLNVNMKLSGKIPGPFLLLLVIALFAFCGCMSKNTVISLSQEEVCRQKLQFGQDDKICRQQSLAEQSEDDVTGVLRQYFASWEGTRYRFGGLSRKGIDCSGLTLLTYKELFGRELPRTVREQVKQGRKIPKTALQAGDLVFFKTGNFQRHVGIYLEEDLFMHASRSRGVMISSLNNVYWQKRFWQAQRLQAGADFTTLSPEIHQQTAAADY